MSTQADSLEARIKRLEADPELGPDAAILGHLRTQLASMRKQEAQRAGADPTPNPVTFSVGMQGRKPR